MFRNDAIEVEEDEEQENMEDWEGLPSVVMVEIYKNLSSRKDKLNASSVCKNWRASAFQVPLSDSLNLYMTKGEKDLEKVTFLSQQFICKVKHVTFTFDVSTEACMNTVENVLILLQNNHQLLSLKLLCSDLCLAYLQHFGKTEEHVFIQRVLYPVMKVLKGKAQLEAFSFPLIQNLSRMTWNNLLPTVFLSRSRLSITKLFLPTFKFVESNKESEEENIAIYAPGTAELAPIRRFHQLQMLSLGHDNLNDEFLATIGLESNVGGLQRLNVVAVQRNPYVSNRGWFIFVKNNPEARVRLTVYGGSGLVAHPSNLIYPSTPLSHFRSYYSKDVRINFLNSIIGWNLETLEHLELVDDNCNWNDIIMQLDPDEYQFLDPIVFAAWRCKKLHTLKLGMNYCGDTLVGIARLLGPNLLNLEIPKSLIIFGSLNLRKLMREMSSALGRPWRPLNLRKRRFAKPPKRTFESGARCMMVRATMEDEL